MFYTRVISAVVLVLGLTATLVDAAREEKKGESNREKLLGVWRATGKNPELPKGSHLEFTSDKKVKLSVPIDDKDKDRLQIFAGTYQVEGARIKVVMPGADGKDQKQTLKIVELTDLKLVTEDEKGIIDEFNRISAK